MPATKFTNLEALKKQMVEFGRLVVIGARIDLGSQFEQTMDSKYYLYQIENGVDKIIYFPQEIKFDKNWNLDGWIDFNINAKSHLVIQFDLLLTKCKIFKNRWYLFDDGIKRYPADCTPDQWIKSDFYKHMINNNQEVWYNIG